jgi:hypothetical protein
MKNKDDFSKFSEGNYISFRVKQDYFAFAKILNIENEKATIEYPNEHNNASYVKIDGLNFDKFDGIETHIVWFEDYFGFDKKEKPNYLYRRKTPNFILTIYIEADGTKKVVLFDKSANQVIYSEYYEKLYVHQLQNMYYFFTGNILESLYDKR